MRAIQPGDCYTAPIVNSPIGPTLLNGVKR